MEPRAQTIRRMFSAISPRYDLLNHLLSGNIDHLWRARVGRKLVAPGTRRVLDLCAGTGDLAFALARRMDSGTVAAADFSGAMLSIGRDKARRLGMDGRVAFVECDGLRIPFPDASFDAVAVAFGLRNLVDWDAGLREMARVARPGGQVAVLEFSLPRRQPMRGLYRLYLTRLLPRIGNLFSRSGAYRYLADTVMQWPEPEQLAERMGAAGLDAVEFRRLSGGIACLHVGVRR